MKKRALILLAILVFFLPFMNMQQANAAVASKVVSETTKKIAKEVIKDTAVQMSFTMMMDYKYVPKDERIKAKEGFEMLCLPKDKKADGECSAPIEVKKDIDKKTIEASVEKKLNAKIAGGVGATKWGKVLDWIVPIFAVGLGVTVIDHMINGDVSDFFDDIAFDALIDAGYVSNVDIGAIETNGNFTLSEPWFVTNYKGAYYSMTLSHKDNALIGKYEFYHEELGWWKMSQGSYVFEFHVSTDKTDGFNYITQSIGENNNAKLKVRLPDPLVNELNSNQSIVKSLYKKLSIRKIAGGTVSTPTVTHAESGLTKTNAPGKPIPIITPAAIPLVEIGTGKPVVPYTKPDGSMGFTTGVNPSTGSQIDVDENSVVVGNPNIIQNPNGSETVSPAPTPQNPTPSPDGGAIKPPPIDPEKTPEFPEGETCSATLKLPKLGLLFNSMSDSFPFSIPWDLKSGFDALFSEIGKEKPKFTYKFNVKGEQKSWDIKLPDYFDSWKPFTDSLLIFVFDVGIIYGIYRLIQGGGS